MGGEFLDRETPKTISIVQEFYILKHPFQFCLSACGHLTGLVYLPSYFPCTFVVGQVVAPVALQISVRQKIKWFEFSIRCPVRIEVSPYSVH